MTETRPTPETPEEGEASGWWRRWRQRPLTGAIGGDVALATLLVAASGLLLVVLTGGGGSSTASGPSGDDSEAGAGADQALSYSRCMRENGVPSFPDPVDGRVMITPDSGLDPSSPEFQAAQEACQDEAQGLVGPGGSGPGPEVEEQVLAFAQCMRENGVDFPDPDFSGGGVRIGGEGIDSDSPEFQAAQEECSEHLEGVGGGAMRSAP